MKIKEELLHFIWQYKLFDTSNLVCTNGEKISIVQFGKLNTNAGPDFSHAQVKIGDTLLAGHIEVHVFSSDFTKHQHHLDDAYKNLILHVVYAHDKEINTLNYPTLELKNYISKDTIHKYEELVEALHPIPCYKLYKKIDELKYQFFMQKLCIERLESKVENIAQIHTQYKGDWNKTATILISGYMGQNINKEAFMRLLTSYDHKIIIKYCKNRTKTEALLMGQSGLLESKHAEKDNLYIQELVKEYRYLKSLNELTPIKDIEWKFAKMRPVAFPTVRISQLAHILFLYPNIFDELILGFDIKTIYKQLDVQCHETWSPSNIEQVTLGKTTIDIIIINAIVPLLYFYGKESGEQSFCDKAIEILEHIKVEKNKITKLYEALEFDNKNALHSQGILELKNNYCDLKNCLNCTIGLEILKRN
jgi:hypothetical protein